MKRCYFLLPVFLLFLIAIVSAQDFEVYISDAGNFNNPPWLILKVDQNGANAEIFTDENLAWPQDILFLEDQEVALISNLSSGIIAKHHATTGAYIENFASGIGGPTRMKIGADSLLYVLQWTGNGKVLRYKLDGTFVDEFTNTGVPQSIGLDWDADGNLYVSSYNGKYVRQYDSNGMAIGNFVSTNLQGPTNIWFNDAGQLMVFDYNGGAIKTFDANGDFVGNFITGLNNPEGLAILPSGDLLIGDGGTSSVKKYTSDGTFIEDFIPSGTASLLRPNAVVLRVLNPSSVDDLELTETIVYPTIGDTFFIQPSFTAAITSIEVFNIAGQQIEKHQASGNLIWAAQGVAEGTYFISVLTEKGKRYTQKVMVKK